MLSVVKTEEQRLARELRAQGWSVKEIERRLGNSAVRLHSFIVSNTSSATMSTLWNREKTEMRKCNILFQEEDKDTYVKSMMDAIVDDWVR